MKRIFTIFTIFAFFAIMAGFQSLCAMQLESYSSGAECFSTIMLTKPTLSPEEDQLWKLVFRACKETDTQKFGVVVSCLGTLIQKGANINAPYTVTFEGDSKLDFERETAHYTPLVFAIASEKISFAKALLELGASTRVPSAMGLPLHVAAINDVRKIVPFLIKHGADINAQDEWGQTALFKVLYNRNYQFFDDLYRYAELDCTTQDNQGQTPLHYAVLVDRPSLTIVKKLLDRGANPHIKDRLGHSALDYARDGHFNDIVAVLEGCYVEDTEGFLAGTIVAASQQAKLAQKAVALKNAYKKKKQRSQRAPSSTATSSSAITEMPYEEKEQISPTKRTESGLEIETTSPTKKIREGLTDLALDAPAQNTVARRTLAFGEEVTSSEQHEQSIGMERLDQRVLNWFDQDFLVQEKGAAQSPYEFARAVYYHQIPCEVIMCIMQNGTSESYVSKSNRADIGTKWYLRGDMIFANPLDNPWLQGRRIQPGYYHCTMDSRGIIYHVGFDPIRDGTSQLSAHLPLALQGRPVEYPGVTQGITHQFTL